MEAGRCDGVAGPGAPDGARAGTPVRGGDGDVPAVCAPFQQARWRLCRPYRCAVLGEDHLAPAKREPG